MPAQRKTGADWPRGTADAVRQNIDLVNEKNAETILILSGDHIYKMNYLEIDLPRENRPRATVALR